MACSVCRKAGHTKRSCPIQKEQKILIQRDLRNMFIQIFPAMIGNPIIMGLLWWQFSKLFAFTRFFNNYIVGTATIDAIPFVDVNLASLPKPLIMGATMQVGEDTRDYLSWLKSPEGYGQETAKDIGSSQIIRYLEEGIKFLFAEQYKEEGTSETSSTGAGYGTN